MTLSIRVKILSFILVALVLSFTANLVAGRTLIIRDKSSYIYDYNLSVVQEVESGISGQIRALRTVSQSLALVSAASTENADVINDFYRRNQDLLPPDGILMVRPVGPAAFGAPVFFPRQSSKLQTVFSSENWRPLDFQSQGIRIGSPVDGKIPIGFRAFDASGNPVVLFALLRLDSAEIRNHQKKMRIELLASGRELLHFGFKYPSRDRSKERIERFRQEVSEKPFSSGAQEVLVGHTKYLASYAKIANTPLTVVGLISKKVSFEAASELVRQSAELGFGILLLAIAATIVFSRGITDRLRLLWLATQKVSKGEFNTRVDLGRAKDEITDLSVSFNAMSQRIRLLMKETAERARMKAELETAQAVQSRFLPSADLQSSNLLLSGTAVPATECAGDWWQYKELGPYVLVAIGDVTGHGVSSALVTAATHGAFSVLLRSYEVEFARTKTPPRIGELMQELNEAVLAAGKGSVSMTMLLSLIDTRTGQMTTCNASHRPPYLYRSRKRGRESSSNIMSAFQVVQGRKVQQLGIDPLIPPETFVFQLEPGDLLVWYTDGLVECANPSGLPLRKTELLKTIARLHEDSQRAQRDKGAHEVCQGLVNAFRSFLGARAIHPEDDTTIVVGFVPEQARFLKEVA